MSYPSNRMYIALLLTASFNLVLSSAALADPYYHHDGFDRHGSPWHGGDIHAFEHRDLAVWRAGGWNHGWHNGRAGWWWVVGGSWYFYSAPIYPYPDPYTPPVVLVPNNPPPVAQAGVTTSPTWYYCQASRNYYPYVSSCASGWQPVPATPASVPPQ